MAAWLCAAGIALRAQADGAWPGRSLASDGWIGDAAHSERASDHNPDPRTGVVRAVDLTAASIPAPDLAAQLARCAAARRDHARLSYVIHAGRIASPWSAWRWRPYTGPNPHTTHLHVSFLPAGDHDGRPFPLPLFEEDDDMTPEEYRTILREELARSWNEPIIADEDGTGLISRHVALRRAYSQARQAQVRTARLAARTGIRVPVETGVSSQSPEIMEP